MAPLYRDATELESNGRGERARLLATVAAALLGAFVAAFFLLTDTNWSSDEGAIRLQARTLRGQPSVTAQPNGQ